MKVEDEIKLKLYTTRLGNRVQRACGCGACVEIRNNTRNVFLFWVDVSHGHVRRMLNKHIDDLALRLHEHFVVQGDLKAVVEKIDI